MNDDKDERLAQAREYALDQYKSTGGILDKYARNARRCRILLISALAAIYVLGGIPGGSSWRSMESNSSALLAIGTVYQGFRFLEDSLRSMGKEFQSKMIEMTEQIASADASIVKKEYIARVQSQVTDFAKSITKQALYDASGWELMMIGAVGASFATRLYG